MESEKRRYRIVGFRDCGELIRIILDPAPHIKKVEKQIGMADMMRNPMGTAQDMMGQQMQQMIHDTFSITREEYQQKQYMVGEIITVSIHREQR